MYAKQHQNVDIWDIVPIRAKGITHLSIDFCAVLVWGSLDLLFAE
jgi:hypothetical protein